MENELILFETADKEIKLTAVSYTHLDVYKRQAEQGIEPPQYDQKNFTFFIPKEKTP